MIPKEIKNEQVKHIDFVGETATFFSLFHKENLITNEEAKEIKEKAFKIIDKYKGQGSPFGRLCTNLDKSKLIMGILKEELLLFDFQLASVDGSAVMYIFWVEGRHAGHRNYYKKYRIRIEHTVRKTGKSTMHMRVAELFFHFNQINVICQSLVGIYIYKSLESLFFVVYNSRKKNNGMEIWNSGFYANKYSPKYKSGTEKYKEIYNKALRYDSLDGKGYIEKIKRFQKIEIEYENNKDVFMAAIKELKKENERLMKEIQKLKEALNAKV